VTTTSSSRRSTGCLAPSLQLYFQPDGDVRACCMNYSNPLGNVARQRLHDIWHGEERAAMQRRLALDDFSHGCENCGVAIATEGRESAYPHTFDLKAAERTDDPTTARWPTFMEFNLSNICNLQCIQCNGELSSSIRIHQEHRPPLPKVYDDQFFEDLRPFLPHLTEIQVAGGEPFLGAENYRLWDLMASDAPHVSCIVVTNATQWNARVERVLEKIPMSITFSIDGITKPVYESIRVGADFDEVMVNFDRFCAYADEVGSALHINHCLMVQNHHEFGDLLLFAEERNIQAEVSVVRYPEEASIACLDIDRMERVLATMHAQNDRVLPNLRLNALVWETELARIETWVEACRDKTDRQVLMPRFDRTILGLPREGTHPFDATAASEALLAASRDGVVHAITVRSGEIIADCSPSMAAILGRPAEELVGKRTEVLDTVMAERFGVSSGSTVLAATEDQIDLAVTYGTTPFRSSLVAERADDGWANKALILFAVLEAP
jgi:radical SAM protein with 4Fe4S-binding SPASM domain